MMAARLNFKRPISFLLSASLIALMTLGSTYLYNVVERYKIKKIFESAEHDRYEKRFVLIGDSFLFGKPRLSKILHGKINNERSQASILDLSEPGIGPFDYYHKLANAYKVMGSIDNVLIFIYLGNDILEVSNIGLGQPIYTDLRFAMKDVFPGISYIIRGFKNAVDRTWYVWNLKKNTGRDRIKGIPKALTMISPKVYNRLFLLEDEKSKEAIRRTEKVLLDIYRTARSKGSEITFILIPPAFQIDERYFSMFETGSNRLNNDLIKTNKIQAEFENFFIENNIDHIDLWEAFRKNRHRDRLYNLEDNNLHWDIDGIMLTANILYERYYKNKNL